MSSLVGWIEPFFLWRGGVDYDGLLLFERKVRIRLDGEEGYDKWRTVMSLVRTKHELFLNLVDFQLSRTKREGADELERVLYEGGSAWRVAERGGQWQLERRVAPEVVEDAEEAMRPGDRAAQHLRVAWVRTYGRDPDPSTAYREAVRAVEAAAKPILSPNDDTATLGKMITNVRDAPQNFRLSLRPPSYEATNGLLAMLQLLWKAQYDRHGTDDEAVPPHAAQPEAEMAVHLAVTLVHWFRGGHVTRV
jgi:hypothetical protein